MTRMAGVLATVGGFAFAASFAVAEESGAAKKVRSIEGISEYRLDNGLRVLLFPDSRPPR